MRDLFIILSENENARALLYFQNDSCGFCEQLKPKINLLENDKYDYITQEKFLMFSNNIVLSIENYLEN